MTKKIVQIALALGIIVMGYFLYESIAKPIRFKAEKEKRYAIVIDKLKDIRTLQIAYKDVNGNFTASFDSLIHFVKFDSLPLIRAIGDVPDTLTEEQAIAKGLVTRETVKISVLDSLFKKNYSIDSIAYVPFTKSKFKMGIGEIETGSKIKVKVFEVIDTEPFDPNQILQVGSLTEANNNAGNWE
jgi:hypothetical protein